MDAGKGPVAVLGSFEKFGKSKGKGRKDGSVPLGKSGKGRQDPIKQWLEEALRSVQESRESENKGRRDVGKGGKSYGKSHSGKKGKIGGGALFFRRNAFEDDGDGEADDSDEEREKEAVESINELQKEAAAVEKLLRAAKVSEDARRGLERRKHELDKEVGDLQEKVFGAELAEWRKELKVLQERDDCQLPDLAKEELAQRKTKLEELVAAAEKGRQDEKHRRKSGKNRSVARRAAEDGRQSGDDDDVELDGGGEEEE